MQGSKNITHLHIGENAVIREFSNGHVACKLMAMGLLPGSVILLVRRSPFGGAFYIRARNHYIALRTLEATHVLLDLSPSSTG